MTSNPGSRRPLSWRCALATKTLPVGSTSRTGFLFTTKLVQTVGIDLPAGSDNEGFACRVAENLTCEMVVAEIRTQRVAAAAMRLERRPKGKIERQFRSVFPIFEPCLQVLKVREWSLF